MAEVDQLELVYCTPVTTILGEGPVWDYKSNRLFWLDFHRCVLHIYDPAADTKEEIQLDQTPSSLAIRASGGLLMATRNGFHHFDLETKKLTLIIDPESDLPDNRFNDGKCDAKGRFWSGTMQMWDKFMATGKWEATGSMWCLDTDLTVHHKFSGVTLSNGTVWSHDNKTMYYVDTILNRVDAFDFDLETGNVSNRRVAFKTDMIKGDQPDGMTIDADGNLWLAHFGGGCVTKWDPIKGELLRTVKLPVSAITSCCFGGPNLDQLYITTASVPYTTEPNGGGIFVLKNPGVRGCPMVQFAG
eukprot:TRINITY_DN3305_c4_g1_i1.p1 TRINITY_DN3305_c4_g1~~TRINITY_DN3305_c4_g1_i1.p1  ORF type:complete len:316 (+),score=86.24 TRINITY_DN3305_c4_g1_i1:47-949(+)